MNMITQDEFEQICKNHGLVRSDTMFNVCYTFPGLENLTWAEFLKGLKPPDVGIQTGKFMMRTKTIKDHQVVEMTSNSTPVKNLRKNYLQW